MALPKSQALTWQVWIPEPSSAPSHCGASTGVGAGRAAGDRGLQKAGAAGALAVQSNNPGASAPLGAHHSVGSDSTRLEFLVAALRERKCLSPALPLPGWVSAPALALFPFPAGAKCRQGNGIGGGVEKALPGQLRFNSGERQRQRVPPLPSVQTLPSVPPAAGDGQQGRSQRLEGPLCPLAPRPRCPPSPSKGLHFPAELCPPCHWIKHPNDLALLGQVFWTAAPSAVPGSFQEPEGWMVTSAQWL